MILPSASRMTAPKPAQPRFSKTAMLKLILNKPGGGGFHFVSALVITGYVR